VLGQESTPVLMPLIFRASRTYETQFETDHETRVLANERMGRAENPDVFYTEICPSAFRTFPFRLRELLIRLAAIVIVGILVCLWLAHYITSPVLRASACRA